jgi:pilus assembly protein Flp/PilA
MVRLYAYLTSLVPTSLRREEGQTLVEYALIIAVLSIGLIVALGVLRDKIDKVFNDIATAL